MILREVDLENVSVRVRSNLRGVCSDNERRLQVSCSVLPEFAIASSNAKTLTADGKYPVQYCKNLQLLIEIQ